AVGWPMLTGTSLLLFVRDRKPYLAVLTLTLLVLQFGAIAGTGARGPFLWSLIYLLILLSFVTRIKVRHLFVAGVAVVAILIGMSLLSPKMYYLLGQENLAREIARRVSERILIGNGINSVAAIELV